jgi:hypothetical protein
MQQAAARNWANAASNASAQEAQKAYAAAMSEAAGSAKLASEADSAAQAAVRARDSADPVKLITEADILKEGIKGTAKAAGTTIKLNASALFGETDVKKFAVELQSQFRAGVEALTHKIAEHKLSDQQLLAVWAAYSAEVADITAYRDALRQVFDDFKTYVRPIGSDKVSYGVRTGSGLRRTRGAWIRWAGKKRLALIKTERADNLLGAIGGWSDPKFVDWVPENMWDFVIAKTQREFGPLETMDHPSGEKSIYDLQQIVREGIAEQQRKDEAEKKAKREHDERDERMRKAAKQFFKDHPVGVPTPTRQSTIGGDPQQELDEYLRDTGGR